MVTVTFCDSGSNCQVIPSHPSSTSSLQLNENEGNTRWNHNRSPRTELYYVALFTAEYLRLDCAQRVVRPSLKVWRTHAVPSHALLPPGFQISPSYLPSSSPFPVNHDRALNKSDLFYLRERKSETRDLHDREPGLRNVPRYSSTIETTLLSSGPRS